MKNHSACWEITHLLRDSNPSARAIAATDRLLHLAAGLEPGAHLSYVLDGDGDGSVRIRLHTNTIVPGLDSLISWVSEDVCSWRNLAGADLTPAEADPGLTDPTDLGVLLELIPSVQAPRPPETLTLDDPLGATSSHERDSNEPPPHDLWPVGLIDDGIEILTALTTLKAQIRVHMAPASLIENQMLVEMTRRSVQSRDPVQYSQFMGAPVRIRCFIGQRGAYLSPRLRAAVGRLGIGLKLVPRDLNDPSVRAAWDGDEFSLSGAIQPFGVAQCLVRVPACGEQAIICGLPTEEATTPPVPLEIDATNTLGLRLGTAVAGNGQSHEVRVSPSELVLHTQVLGATGTGKSTILAALVQEAVAAGLGVTVIESHGPLVQRIVDELPAEAIDRTIVVRSGDVDNPVPINPLSCSDPELISEIMLQVMRELLDPTNLGFLGPRFERIFGQLMLAQRHLFGDRTSLAALPHFLRSPNQIKSLANAVATVDSVLGNQIMSEMGNLSAHDFGELVGWTNAKFQRLIATTEMRTILSTGMDAVDVSRVMRERSVLLVDLSAPTVGPLGAQLLGEIWLAKHWAALAGRTHKDQPHLLIVDEAHLFGSGLLPRLLAEARKFQVGVVLAHQHLEQLTPHLREAALATTSNVIVFRSGPLEAAAAYSRLGAWSGGSLTRLPRFQAATTLSLGNEQSDAFTLFVDHNSRTMATPQSAHIAKAIERRSRELYVEPYRDCPEITVSAVDAKVANLGRPESSSSSGSSFLDEWLAKRKAENGQDF